MRPIFALLVVTLTLTAFESPEGPAGPSGPVGPQGVIGPQGSQGEQGPTGPAGIANIRILTFTLFSGDFVKNDEGGAELAAYPAQYITQSVVDEGAVLAYTDLGTVNIWAPLPYVFDTVDGESTQTFIYAVGEFGVFLVRPIGLPPIASLFDGDRVRVVIFPSGSGDKLNDVDTEDYDAVMALVDAERNEL